MEFDLDEVIRCDHLPNVLATDVENSKNNDKNVIGLLDLDLKDLKQEIQSTIMEVKKIKKEYEYYGTEEVDNANLDISLPLVKVENIDGLQVLQLNSDNQTSQEDPLVACSTNRKVKNNQQSNTEKSCTNVFVKNRLVYTSPYKILLVKQSMLVSFVIRLFIVKTSFNVHVKTHTSKMSYSCDVCQKKFAYNTSLITHKRMHTAEKPYSCDACQKKFTNKADLIKHKEVHTGEKPYSCDICQKKFAYNTSLITHKRMHTGEKPYSCDVCQKKFADNTNLIKHKRVHTGEKPYSCDVCQKKFTNKADLIKHKRVVHTGEKPYSCDVCQKKFAYNTSLITHKRVHTGEKPYSCDVCQKKYAYNTNLIIHKRVHTGK